MMRSTKQWMLLGAALALAGCGSGVNDTMQSAQTVSAKTKISTPTDSGAGATQTSIFIQVCAGATGLPAGFSLQWMTQADFDATGWVSSSDTTTGAQCDASFSGNANLSRYNLAAGQCVTVDVGEFLFDNGASTSCACGLTCGTTYVFRAFGHATSTFNRSDFTGNFLLSTLACGNSGGCTLTQGYWKTHSLDPTGQNSDEWPPAVESGGLTLGTVSYDEPQLLSILNTPAAGNGLIVLAHQLIAAKLNIANGADASSLGTAISDADALIGGLVVPPVGSGFLKPALTSVLTTTLTDYNEGAIGPGHCD